MGRPLNIAAPYVGREEELELLENAYARAVRDRRAQLVTIFGDPGIGKSRLAREFFAGLERTTVLDGTLAAVRGGTRVSAAGRDGAGGRGDLTRRLAARRRSRSSAKRARATRSPTCSASRRACSTRLGRTARQEIAWAAHEWAVNLAEAQPLVLGFEDLHWAEEPLLDLVEHLADRIDDAPVLIVCLARPELLESRPGWGGGRRRSISIDLAPLGRARRRRARRRARGGRGAPGRAPAALLDKTEGNPLFVEETVRMLAEQREGAARADPRHGAGADRGADRSAAARLALGRPARRAVGRVFWRGAVAELDPTLDVDAALADLVDRAAADARAALDDLGRGGVPLPAHADPRRRLRRAREGRAGTAPPSVRRLARGRGPATSSSRRRRSTSSAPPHSSPSWTAQVPADLGPRRPTRSSAPGDGRSSARRTAPHGGSSCARSSSSRASSAGSTPRERRGGCGSFPAASVEMEEVRTQAQAAATGRSRGSPSTQLAEIALNRNADVEQARSSAARRSSCSPPRPATRAPRRSRCSRASAGGRATSRASSATRARRSRSPRGGAGRSREPRARRARGGARGAARAGRGGLGARRGRPRSRSRAGASRRPRGWRASAGRSTSPAVASTTRSASSDAARDLFDEIGAASEAARTQQLEGLAVWQGGDPERAEQLVREAVALAARSAGAGEGDRGAAHARASSCWQRATSRRPSAGRSPPSRPSGCRTRCRGRTSGWCFGLVRAAQGRDDEAELLLRDAIDSLAATDYRNSEPEPLAALRAVPPRQGAGRRGGGREDRLAALLEPESAAPII